MFTNHLTRVYFLYTFACELIIISKTKEYEIKQQFTG